VLTPQSDATVTMSVLSYRELQQFGDYGEGSAMSTLLFAHHRLFVRSTSGGAWTCREGASDGVVTFLSGQLVRFASSWPSPSPCFPSTNGAVERDARDRHRVRHVLEAMFWSSWR
jgi:hypothetical protein